MSDQAQQAVDDMHRRRLERIEEAAKAYLDTLDNLQPFHAVIAAMDALRKAVAE